MGFREKRKSTSLQVDGRNVVEATEERELRTDDLLDSGNGARVDGLATEEREEDHAEDAGAPARREAREEAEGTRRGRAFLALPLVLVGLVAMRMTANHPERARGGRRANMICLPVWKTMS